MTDNIRRPKNVKILSQIYLDANILKRQEIEDQLQWTTSRNWPMANRLVTQSMMSHDLVKRAQRRQYRKRDGIGQTPCSYERYLVVHATNCVDNMNIYTVILYTARHHIKNNVIDECVICVRSFHFQNTDPENMH